MMNLFVFYQLSFIVFSGVTSSRVLELSDKFIDISNEGVWFVKFYAPWCAHCRRLEPIWAHVAQSLFNTPIKVAKVDCTRFTAVATHFQVRVYPTILFIKGSVQHEYSGERTKDDLVTYALRMFQPAIQRLSHEDNIAYLKESHPVFFGYVGRQVGPLWDMYTFHAEKYQPHIWFYSMPYELAKDHLDVLNESVFVYKEDNTFLFEGNNDKINDKDWLNTTLEKWINSERFGFFPKITRSNIHHLMETEKFLVIAVVSENKLNEISPTERDFKDMIEGIIKEKKRELHNRFQFGWIGNPDLANSIAISELSLPHLLVLNSTTNHHHIPDDDPVLMTPEAICNFLDQINNQLAPTYGGNSLPVRIKRGVFEVKTTLVNMWLGNPVLTALVFGLPLGFLSLICYSVCCADILDAEDEDSQDTHEKKD